MEAAGSCEARCPLSAHTLLFDLPPALLGELCAVLDSCDGALGWRGLGECGPEGGGAQRARSILPAPRAPRAAVRFQDSVASGLF